MSAQAPPPVAAFSPPAEAQPAQGAANYIVGAQDVLIITSYDQPELTGKFTIESDGSFTYPYIGRVNVGGMTLRGVKGTEEESGEPGLFQRRSDHRRDRAIPEPEDLHRRRSPDAWRVSDVGQHAAGRSPGACGIDAANREWRGGCRARFERLSCRRARTGTDINDSANDVPDRLARVIFASSKTEI